MNYFWAWPEIKADSTTFCKPLWYFSIVTDSSARLQEYLYLLGLHMLFR